MVSPVDNTVQLVHFSKMMTMMTMMMTMMMMVLMTAIRTMRGIMVALKKKLKIIKHKNTLLRLPTLVQSGHGVLLQQRERDAF